MRFFDPGGAGEMLRRALVIAGDQTCANAQSVESSHGLRCVRPQRVTEREQTNKCVVARNDDDR